jgi:NAD(P)-dependent dehydrogenase (short-subunit alcohol dehydrogenase family)
MDAMTPVALITGASRGLGRSLASSLSERGWQIVADGRNPEPLRELNEELPALVVVSGDVTDPAHREVLIAKVREFGRLDLLVNNASELGTSPLPPLREYPLDVLRHVYETNVIGPLALIQGLLPELRAAGGIVLNVSSDAAVEPYEGWGGYGSSKAALDQASAVLAVEEPDLAVYAVDPGDMRTDMHQRAFPGEDISDRPLPEAVVPALLRLIDVHPDSGRYRAAEFVEAVAR